MAVRWEYFDRYEDIMDKYLPATGEGETVATQIVTAVTKLIYKWYNDGDVYDNTYIMEGWCNDLSSYANWLYHNTHADEILTRIRDCWCDGEYEDILAELADTLFSEKYLRAMSKENKDGSIYKCDGPFRFEEPEDEDEFEDEEW